MRNNIFMLLILFSVLFFTMEEEENYIYYGHVPSRIWYAQPKMVEQSKIPGEYTIVNVKENATLTIVGWYDNTRAEVYTLPNKALINTLNLNKMEKTHILLPNGTFFKLKTNKPVFALLTAGELNFTSPSGPLPADFIPSIDGVAIGKEFIFMASQGLDQIPYRFRALEDAEIQIEDEAGASVQSFKLSANSWKDLAFKSYKVYHVTSTGNIMIQTWGIGRSVYIPSVTGSYVGKAFYSMSSIEWNPRFWTVENLGFHIVAVSEDAKVSVYDVEFKKKIQELTVPAKKSVSIRPETVRMGLGAPTEIFFESDKPIVVSYINHGSFLGYGTGLIFLTVKPGETTEIYVPVNCSAEAYIFTYKETNLVLDDLQLKLGPDEYLPLHQGFHEISADAELLIQITHWPNDPEVQAIESFASIIPPSQSAKIEKQVQLKPITTGETPITLYVGASAAAIAALAAIIFLIRSRRKKNSTNKTNIKLHTLF
jgi:hypothetical protein